MLLFKETKKIAVILIAALVFGAVFISYETRAGLALPTTICDDTWNFPNLNHLGDNESLEDGTKAFKYGPNNNDFVSEASNAVTFRPELLFVPDANSVFKVYVLNAACTLTYADSSPAVVPGLNIITYNRDTNTLQFNDEEASTVSGGVPRFLGFDVWDGVSGSSNATYSYLVDLENLQNPTDNSVPPERRLTPDPVIIIPGILGSEQKNGVWVIDPILHTYDDLIDTLKANGYVEGYDLFTFPYNWRKSNVETAVGLELKIQEVRNFCECDKVDLVAHSMGGLVARQYIQSDRYNNDVDQLIFLGTPHLGSPQAYLTWEAGEIKPSQTGFLSTFVFKREARKFDFLSVLAYVRAMVPSARELLPIFDYIKDDSNGIVRKYPLDYPINFFLDELNANVGNLLDSGVDITNIVGKTVTDNTIRYLRVVEYAFPIIWDHGYPIGFEEKIGDRGLEMGEGDNTVPIQSSSFINNNLVEVQYTHNELPTKAEGIIYQELTNNIPSNLFDTFDVPNFKIFIVKMLSPADMMIVAPDGQRIGKDFETGLEFNEIENAFYTGYLTDDEFITILNPLDGEYKIKTQGTDNGSYTLATGYISGEALIEDEFTSQTATGIIREQSISVDNIAPENLNIVQVITLESTIQDIEKFYSLGWINKKSTRDNLVRKLQRIINHDKETNLKNFKTFLSQLEREHPKHINDQAYQLLFEDISWLINN